MTRKLSLWVAVLLLTWGLSSLQASPPAAPAATAPPVSCGAPPAALPPALEAIGIPAQEKATTPACSCSLCRFHRSTVCKDGSQGGALALCDDFWAVHCAP